MSDSRAALERVQRRNAARVVRLYDDGSPTRGQSIVIAIVCGAIVLASLLVVFS